MASVAPQVTMRCRSGSQGRLVKRVSFLPYVLYRMVLGGFLLVMLYT